MPTSLCEDNLFWRPFSGLCWGKQQEATQFGASIRERERERESARSGDLTFLWVCFQYSSYWVVVLGFPQQESWLTKGHDASGL